jgi:3-oxoadipate enol-lactonase
MTTIISTSNIDITISYDDFGTGETPIIFIHGFPFNKSSWKPQMAFFKETHRVIAYDIRGFGQSGIGEEAPSIPLFADDLILFMDTLQIKKAIVCGLSMGGYILLDAINRYPTRFAALVLCDTQCISDTDEARAKRHKTIIQINEVGLEPFADGFVKSVFCPLSLTTKKTLVNIVKEIILNTALPTVVTGLTALADRKDKCEVLAEIKVPTLILCGAEDVVTPIAQSQFLHKNIPNSTLNIIDKAGHLSNLEQSEVFNALMLDFLKK